MARPNQTEQNYQKHKHQQFHSYSVGDRRFPFLHIGEIAADGLQVRLAAHAHVARQLGLQHLEDALHAAGDRRAEGAGHDQGA